jgi:hypothetical protein
VKLAGSRHAANASLDVTVSDALPLLPPAAAVMTACPGATPVTRPVAFTAATDGVPVDHVTAPVAIAAPV